MISIIIFLLLSIITSVMAYNAYNAFEAADLYYRLYQLGAFDKYLGTPSSIKSTLLIVLTVACWICFIISIIFYYKTHNQKEVKDVICKKCGVPNSAISINCKNCGSKLKGDK